MPVAAVALAVFAAPLLLALPAVLLDATTRAQLCASTTALVGRLTDPT